MRAASRTVAAAMAALALLPAVATADERITAAPGNRYANPDVSIDQGERLTFLNQDIATHDVTARTAGSDGKPLFGTPLISTGTEVRVEGSQYLTTGSYAFFCSVHTFMTGTINVTSAGTPVPRPGTGAPAAPDVDATLRDSRLSKVRRAGRLRVRVTSSAPATVQIRAALVRKGKRVTIASGRVTLASAGSRSATVRLSRAGRRALAKLRSATVELTSSVSGGTGGTTRKALRG